VRDQTKFSAKKKLFGEFFVFLFSEESELLLLVFDELDLGDLTDHADDGSLEHGNAGKALAALELIDDEGAAGLEDQLAHISLLDELGVLDLLSSGGFLSHLEVNLDEAAGGVGGADVAVGGVSDLDLVGVLQNHGLDDEGLAGLEVGLGLLDHDVTVAGHVSFWQTFRRCLNKSASQTHKEYDGYTHISYGRTA
jgi:hypothetical protein